MDAQRARLVATRDLTPDIRQFEIFAEGVFAPPSSGAHLRVVVNIDGHAETRAYSLLDASPERGYRIAVKKLPASRGGSAYMWSLEPGALLSVCGPRNDFALTPGASEYLLVAAGIGITPIFSHAMALRRANAKFRVAYAARRREDFALLPELLAALGEKLKLYASGEGERIDLGAEFANLSPDGEAYVCGPIGMLEAAKRAWREAERASHRLRFETFGAGGALPTAAFSIRIPRLGKEIVVPESRTMLEALEGAGVEMISDCQRGECGLCALPILNVDGVVDHRDVFFSDEEKAANTKLCACVSRVYGRSVTVDIADRSAAM